MDFKNISEFVTDNMNDVVYVSDVETYELYYLNKIGKQAFGFQSDDEYRGRKCYEVLQGENEPCEFCTNHLIQGEEAYKWQYFNPIIARHFLLTDRLGVYEGRKLRIEIATDITPQIEMQKDIEKKLEEQDVLLKCIETLHSTKLYDEPLMELLSIMGDFYKADRAYVFEKQPNGVFIDNTYEWCKEGIEPAIHMLQDVEIRVVQRWFDKYEEVGEFYINTLDKEVDQTSEEYVTLQAQGIVSLITAPLRDANSNAIGFIGIDNPAENCNNKSFIRASTKFIVNFLEKHKMIDKLNVISTKDALTKLKNRYSYNLELESLENDGYESLGIAYVDIDGLKKVNDTYGHKFGDELILNMAKVLKKVCASKSYRIGGDEFVIVWKNVEKELFESKIEELRTLIENEKKLHASVGANWSKKGENDSFIAQMEEAEQYMYTEKAKFKKAQGSTQKYNTAHYKKLKQDINNGNFTVWLQPQIDFEKDEVYSAEALVRKIDDNSQVLLPNTFIPEYEKEGIIAHLDYFVFEEICKTLKNWISMGLNETFKVAVNFSKQTIFDDDTLKKLLKICENYKIKPNRIMIEITESIRTFDERKLADLIKEYSQNGFSISLDDFGSGFSNFDIVNAVDFDEIKIDKSIIKNLEQNPKSKTITKVAVDMCENLDTVTSIAEGVETEEQSKIIKNMNCKKGQGYYFGRPMSIEQFTKTYIMDITE